MTISKLAGEGITGKHYHSYEATNTGRWEWCAECECMVTNPCQHDVYLVCHERSEYIRLKNKYEKRESNG